MKNKMTSVFNAYYREYDRWYDENSDIFRREVEAIKNIFICDGISLEVGVGTGRFAEKLKIRFGIDISENMLKIAKKRGIYVICNNSRELSFKNETFDCVYFITSLCFIRNKDLTLREVRRVLKKNGKVIVGFINKDSYIGKAYEKKKKKNKFYRYADFLSVNDVIGVFKKHGFSPERISGTLERDQSESDVKDKYIRVDELKNYGFIVILFNKGEDK